MFTAAITFLCTCGLQKKAEREQQVSQKLVAQMDSFSFFINNIFLPAAKIKTGNPQQLQALFLQARLAYKKFEWAAEYFTPASAKRLNGAPVPDVEGGQLSVPQGLQVIEGLLFPQYDTQKQQELIKQLELLPPACDECKGYCKNIDVLNWQVFDAAKLQVFRILALGISGFDAPIAENSVNEAACSLTSLQHTIAIYDHNKETEKLFYAAIHYLLNNTGFDGFDRAAFITKYASPLTTGLTKLEQNLHIAPMQYTRLLKQSAATLFDNNAFDATAFAPGTAYQPNTKQIALGEKLFNDPILSGLQMRSCASCHQPAKAFTDGLVKNTEITGKALLPRNTPTLLNAALQPAQFYDMRVATLEEQAMDVVQNRHEMGGTANSITGRLWQNNKYRQLFTEAFPTENRTAIDTLEIAHAIAEYIRSLVKLNSRFDAYMHGDTTAMGTSAVNGFNLFMGKAKCGTCHYMPLFNGTLPPDYVVTEPEVIGVPANNNHKIIDGDLGRYAAVNVPFYKFAFKTPTLRNAARTAPYMHNGVFNTLDEVLDFYNKGGGAGLGIVLPNQTLPATKLNLSAGEVKDIIDFIKCLNSRLGEE